MSKEEGEGTTEIKDDEETKVIYFIVFEPKETEESTKNKDKEPIYKSAYIPKLISTKTIDIKNESYIKHKVFKLNIKDEKEIKIVYEINNDIYEIIFTVKENYFLYDVKLLKRDKYITILPPQEIKQNIIPYYNKLQIFKEALKENNENEKIEQLYNESISLYKEKKDFNLLIFLFHLIYENENLCPKLLKAFNGIKVLENTKIDKNLSIHLDFFHKFFSEDDNFVKTHKYDLFDFYGILLCYLHYYDINNKYFSVDINKLSKTNPEILYEILIKFLPYFFKPLNQNIEFYYKFMEFIKNNKDIKTFDKALKYIKDIETYLNVIYKYKDYIISYFKKPYLIMSELKLVKKKHQEDINCDKENNELKRIIDLIKEIIDYLKEKKILLIYFTTEFWSYLLEQYKVIIDLENINNCKNLRVIFKEYYNLIKFLYKDEKNMKEEYKIIYNNIKTFYERDEFAYILDKNVKEYLANNKETNPKKLGLIRQFIPYFDINDPDDRDLYINYKNLDIFDYLIFEEEKDVEYLIISFRKLQFEEVFKNNIKGYIYKMVSKIKNISTFGIVIKLIDVEKIKDKKKYYYNLLEEKYDSYINEIESLKNEEELNKEVKIICDFIDMIYLFEKEENIKDENKKENNCRFLTEKIDKLDKKIKSLIYSKLIGIVQGDQNKDKNSESIENRANKYKDMKESIFKYFIKERDDVDNIIKVICSLSDVKDKKQFLKDLIEKCKFTKDDFYQNNERKKIELLCDLNEKLNKKKENEKENGNEFKIEDKDLGEDLAKTLVNVRKELELENNKFSKKKLEEFLKSKEANKKDEIIKKLNLIKIVQNDYNVEQLYDKLIKQINIMNEEIEKLNFIKKSLIKFHKNQYQNEINDINNTIRDIETLPLDKYRKGEIKNSIENLKKDYEELAKKVEKVKNLLIFKIIFDNTKGNDEVKRFETAENSLKKIKDSFINYQSDLIEYKNEKNEELNKLYDNLDEIMKKIKKYLQRLKMN